MNGVSMFTVEELRTGDPFRYLGLHQIDKKWSYTVFAPHADRVFLSQQEIPRVEGTDVFRTILKSKISTPVQLTFDGKSGHEYSAFDSLIDVDDA